MRKKIDDMIREKEDYMKLDPKRQSAYQKSVAEKVGHTLFRKSEMLSKHKAERILKEGKDIS